MCLAPRITYKIGLALLTNKDELLYKMLREKKTIA
jgi:hypothetical protein